MDRRAGVAVWLTILLSLSSLLLVIPGLALQAPDVRKKALIVWGGEMREPKKCVDIFAP